VKTRKHHRRGNSRPLPTTNRPLRKDRIAGVRGRSHELYTGHTGQGRGTEVKRKGWRGGKVGGKGVIIPELADKTQGQSANGKTNGEERSNVGITIKRRHRERKTRGSVLWQCGSSKIKKDHHRKKMGLINESKKKTTNQGMTPVGTKKLNFGRTPIGGTFGYGQGRSKSQD